MEAQNVIHGSVTFFAVILGEVANFAAYAFAPAILVTPLGALSIIFRFYTYLPFYDKILLK